MSEWTKQRLDQMIADVPVEELDRFFSDLDFRIQIRNMAQRELDRHVASAFNVFAMIEPDENKLSDILALLLDPRGSHGQEDLFLRHFLRKLHRESALDLTEARVAREALTHSLRSSLRRIDILVTTGTWVMALENKVEAGEQKDQVNDYCDHLQRMGRPDYCLVFLTADGREPESIQPVLRAKLCKSNQLFVLNYGNVCDWLEECRQRCEAEKVRFFLGDFIHYIRTRIIRTEHR